MIFCARTTYFTKNKMAFEAIIQPLWLNNLVKLCFSSPKMDFFGLEKHNFTKLFNHTSPDELIQRTFMVVLDFLNDISLAIDRGMKTIGIFMDLSKAFDTIDHNSLLHKLSHYGFRGISYDWFQNYLCNRKQYVSYNSSKSTTV